MPRLSPSRRLVVPTAWALGLIAALLAPVLLLSACGNSSTTTTSSVKAYSQSGKKDAKGRPIIEPGDQGPEIAKLQKTVNDAKIQGVSLKETGVYDDATLAVILAFQYRQGLQPDGVIGPNTWDHIEHPDPINTALDPLTLVQIAKVAVNSPADGKALLDKSLADAGVTTTKPASGGSASGGGGSAAKATATHAVVKLGEQQVYFYRNGDQLVRKMPCSSGRDGLTPVGTFAVERKSANTTSLSSSEISMKWMTNFNGNIGFHGIPVKGGQQLDTPLGVRPVSAGCVRMADADAKFIYDNMPIGSTVLVAY